MPIGDCPTLLFTKPWKNPIPEVADVVARLGFDGVELPVRPGYPVAPDNAHALSDAARQFADRGLVIGAVAGDPTDAVVAACGEAGVPVVRICPQIRKGEAYLDCEARLRREFEALIPKLEDAGVVLGLQNHCNRCVPNALAVRRLIEPLGSDRVRLVWDPAHEALEGQLLDLAAGVAWDILQHVNLKNAVRLRTNPGVDAPAAWRIDWTLGRDGFASWPLALSELKRRHYTGALCFCAEYSDESQLESFIAADLAFARGLLQDVRPR